MLIPKDNIKFIRFDCDEFPGLSKNYRIKKLPTFILFCNGKPVERCEGTNENKVKFMLEQCD